VQVQLGEQDFADGTTPIYSSEIRAAGNGEAYPFDGTLFGHDVKSSGLGAFDYLHTFDLGGGRPVAATLTVGLIDIDSPADHPFDTIALAFDGVSQPDKPLAGISAVDSPSSVEVVDISVPIELLGDGMLHVNFAARRAGYGNLGNAIEADFSRLVIETAAAVVPGPDDLTPDPIIDPGPPSAVPLPPALMPAGILLAGLFSTPRRRLRRWLGI
jgi:hypothetical protein